VNPQDFRSIVDVSRQQWLEGLGLSEDEIPDAVIVEGSWWRADRQARRLDYLGDVRELGFPDIYWGTWKGNRIAFCMAYGAPRAIEIIYLFGFLGARLAVQIGTCGGLQSHLKSGDIILPESAEGLDGVAHLFSDSQPAVADGVWVGHADELLQARQHTTYRGPHMTFSPLFADRHDCQQGSTNRIGRRTRGDCGLVSDGRNGCGSWLRLGN
jgi:uridine phosphorylase